MLDLYKTELKNDGEDLVYSDFNDAQRFLASRLFDQVLGKLIGSATSADPEFESQQGADPSTVWAYALSVGGGNPKQGSAPNKVKIGAGTLLQKIANANGNEPQLLAYTFPGTDEVTLANGDATNPRVDMIQMQLSYLEQDLQARDFQDAITGANSSQNMNKKRQVQCALTVKQGVAAASPVYPTPDAGCVPIACVVVGATYAGATALKYVDTAGAVIVLHDLRMPLNIRPRLVVNPEPTPIATVISPLFSTDNPQPATTGNGQGPVATHLRDAASWVFVASTNPVYYPLGFPVGDVITSYILTLVKGDTHNAVSAHLAHSDVGGDTNDSAGTTSGTAAGTFALAESVGSGGSPGGVAIASGEPYAIKVTPGGAILPSQDRIYGVTVFRKRIGTAGAIVLPCPVPRGRLVAIAASSANGSHTANTARLASDVAGVGSTYLADVSGIAETTATVTRHEYKMTDLEAALLFTAGPVVQGNGTHAPPIWCNGKRAYEEQLSLGAGAATPAKLSARFEFPATAVDVYDVTFYVAEGL